MFCIGCMTEIKNENEEICPQCGFNLRTKEIAGQGRRFAARYLVDFLLFTVLFWMAFYCVLAFVFPTAYLKVLAAADSLKMLGFLFNTPILVLFFLFDALVYKIFGTTPGRFLFGITYVDFDGKKISAGLYLKRNFREFRCAWWYGFFTGLAFIGRSMEFSRNGFTSYDRDLKVLVLANKTNVIKTALGVILAILALFAELYSRVPSSEEEKGDAEAQVLLGQRYLVGDGVEKNVAEAVRLFRLSAEQGNALGQGLLGQCYLLGDGVEKNVPEAVRLFRLSADQGDALGQAHLGECYLEGIGVEKNVTEAVRLFRLSAEQGNALGQVYLGICYIDGVGVEKNVTEAVRLFRLSAGQGSDVGQACLGVCYLHGIGVEKNETEAVKYLRLSAEQGNQEAITLLQSIENQK